MDNNDNDENIDEVVKKEEADDDDDDDTRHMNDSTMPPPPPATSAAATTTITATTNMPPPSSKQSNVVTTNKIPNKKSHLITTTTRPSTLTTSVVRTPAEIAMGRQLPRQKAPTSLGLGDWIRLLNVSKDIAQLKGQSIRRNVTVKEVLQHNTIHDGWIILQKKVYNISPYLPYHPGGIKIMKSTLGKDATILFHKYHSWVNIDGLIGKLLIGYIDSTTSNQSSDDDDSDNDDKS